MTPRRSYNTDGFFVVQGGKPSAWGVSPAMKAELIAEHLGSVKGREKLAAAMTKPIRQRLNYSSYRRSIFKVESLPEGALPIYDKDIDITTIVVGS